MARILYVEDHMPTRTIVARYLEDAGHQVFPLSTACELYAAIPNERFDIALIDLGLPDNSGARLLETLRTLTLAPVLVLTGDDTEQTQCVSLSKGADAFLCKPVSPRVIAAHVDALLRRCPAVKGPAPTPSFGPLRFKNNRIWTVGDKELPLSSQESRLLEYLVKLEGAVVSRSDLLHEVWGYPRGSKSRVVDETLRRLRIKLDTAASTVTIETLWGRGVRLTRKEEP